MPTRRSHPLVPRPPHKPEKVGLSSRTRAADTPLPPVRVQDVVAASAVSCEPLTTLLDAAHLLAVHQCGAIPVLERGSRRPLGVIASRDIVCRVLAAGRDARRLRVADAMTEPVVTVGLEAAADEAADLMERHRIRRLVAVDAAGRCAGVVTLADLVHALPLTRLGRLLAAGTEPRPRPSART